MTAIAAGGGGLARVLEEDPDLGELLEPTAFERASATATAPVLRLPAGRLPAIARPGGPVFGMLVVDGLIGNRVIIPERSHLELLSPGDVLRPWVGLGADASTPSRFEWRAFYETRLCVLDERFCRGIRDFPEIYEALADRLVLRSRRLNFQLAVNAMIGISERVLVALWHFADRWGRVTPEGTTLTWPLSHGDLADIVAASRPSVTTALVDLRRRGSIAEHPSGWLLHGARPARLEELEEKVALPAGRTAG